MHRTFHRFNQVLDLLVPRSKTGVQRNWCHLEALFRLRAAPSGQAPAEQSIHGALEGLARPPLLLLHKPGNIVVNGQSSPHIMMLCHQAS